MFKFTQENFDDLLLLTWLLLLDKSKPNLRQYIKFDVDFKQPRKNNHSIS